MIFLIVACLAAPALPLAAWFKGVTDSERWPPITADEIRFRPLVEIGRPLAKPACLFVNDVMPRVDYRYSCVGPWHPIFRISLVVLSLGYSGCLFLGSVLVWQKSLRRQEIQARQGVTPQSAARSDSDFAGSLPPST